MFKNQFQVRRFVTTACRLLENYEYKKSFPIPAQPLSWRKESVQQLVKKEIRRGTKNLLKLNEKSSLAKKCKMENIVGFKWDSIMKDVLKHIPLLHAAIVASITSTLTLRHLFGQGNASWICLPFKIFCSDYLNGIYFKKTIIFHILFVLSNNCYIQVSLSLKRRRKSASWCRVSSFHPSAPEITL